MHINIIFHKYNAFDLSNKCFRIEPSEEATKFEIQVGISPQWK